VCIDKLCNWYNFINSEHCIISNHLIKNTQSAIFLALFPTIRHFIGFKCLFIGRFQNFAPLAIRTIAFADGTKRVGSKKENEK
jgi:hypothetical protein